MKLWRVGITRRPRVHVVAQDNIIITLTDVITGEIQQHMAHNTPTNIAFGALATWVGGAGNALTGAQPWPSQMELGTGTGVPEVTDTALFAPAANTLITVSFTSVSGTTITATAQWTTTAPAGTYTEAGWEDVNGGLWFHTVFNNPVTKLATQNLTVEWAATFTT